MHAQSATLNFRQRLVKIRDQIFDVLNSHR